MSANQRRDSTGDDGLIVAATAIGGACVSVTLASVISHLLGYGDLSAMLQFLWAGVGIVLGIVLEISARLATRRSSRF